MIEQPLRFAQEVLAFATAVAGGGPQAATDLACAGTP